MVSASRKAPPARAPDHPETEPLPLRLEDEDEAGGGPCRPHGERPPHGVAAAGRAAPYAAVVPFPSGRRGGSGWSSRRRGSAKVRRRRRAGWGARFDPLSGICGFWGGKSGVGARETAAHRTSSRAGGMNGKGEEERLEEWVGCQAVSDDARFSSSYKQPRGEGKMGRVEERAGS